MYNSPPPWIIIKKYGKWQKISAIEQTFQPHTCSNSQGARVFGFINFMHFDFAMYKNPKLCCFSFLFLHFKQVFCSKSRYQYKCHIFIYLGPQSHNIKKTLKPYRSPICMVSDFETFFWHIWTGFQYSCWFKTETSKKNLLLSFGFVMISRCLVGLLKLLHNTKRI